MEKEEILITFTGATGSGKSILALHLLKYLSDREIEARLFDDVKHSREEREEVKLDGLIILYPLEQLAECTKVRIQTTENIPNF